MTRADDRAKCIEALARYCSFPAAAFDALNGIARVDPIEATEEMIKAVYRADVQTCDDCQWPQDHKTGINLATAAGDLTNPPERADYMQIIGMPPEGKP